MTFYETITAAVRDLAEHGFDSIARVEMWAQRIREAAARSLTPQHVLDAALRAHLGAVYRRMVEQGGTLKVHPGVSRFTVEKLKPALRAELERRMMASANLIRLNRAEMIDRTVQRFSGWASSVPPGGSHAVDKREEGAHIRKALAQLPFSERRVMIDQGHKMVATINELIAQDGGAIAVKWRSHWQQSGYNYREDHRERDGKYYAIRGNWALAKGLMKAGPDGYYDEITKVAQEPYCRCWAVWAYNLRDLPDNMVTPKGAATITKRVKP